MALYPHLHLRSLGTASKEFRAFGGGSQKEPEPVPDRREHGEKLQADLQQTLTALSAITREQARLNIPDKQRGMTITVESRHSVPLFVSPTARATTQGLKLLTFQSNIPRPLQNEPSLDVANFFVSRSTFKSLNNSLEKYADWSDDTADYKDLLGEAGEDGRRPRNFKLFESAALIRPATLRDFWTDGIDRFPRKRGLAVWEVWTRAGYEEAFINAAETYEVKLSGRETNFVETSVRNVIATPENMQRLVRVSGAVVELRGASSFMSDYMNQSTAARRSLAANLSNRIVAAPAGSPRVVVLDTGVDYRNPLLSSSIDRARCHTVSDDWPVRDHDGHGTKMAGVALFGDLSNINPQGAVQLITSLESVVVAAPVGGDDIPARDAIQEAVELLEEVNAPRVFCLAQTAPGEPEDGRPSSTSAALDQLAYSDGKQGRLFCVAVGNVDHSEDEPYQVDEYIERNRRHGVQSPAQALNALAVGAVTMKISGSQPLVAPEGDLSPTSRTSQEWEARLVKKPDVVAEGGNFEIDPGGVFSRPSPQNLVLTTSRNPDISPIAMTGETSAATAAVSGLAAKLMARYPRFRSETVRGLIVHSAEWTSAMLQQQRELEQATNQNDALAGLMARYGWGIPNEQKLYASTENLMTMVVEDDLRPYELGDDNRPKLKEMKYFKLPWPKRELSTLNQTEVEMRCTLSYFVEPDPHAIARNRYDRYPSHRLKFDVKRFSETDTKAQSRVNMLGDDDETTSVPDDGWLIGRRLKSAGTIVQDVWTGPAYRLADRDGISVLPVRGWWGDIRDSERYLRKVRFSLIVSVRIPQGGVNIYRAVRAAVPARVLVESPVTVTT